MSFRADRTLPPLPLHRVAGLLQWDNLTVKLPQKLPAATVSFSSAAASAWRVWYSGAARRQWLSRRAVVLRQGITATALLLQPTGLIPALLQIQTIMLAMVEAEQAQIAQAEQAKRRAAAAEEQRRKAVLDAACAAGAASRPAPAGGSPSLPRRAGIEPSGGSEGEFIALPPHLAAKSQSPWQPQRPTDQLAERARHVRCIHLPGSSASVTAHALVFMSLLAVLDLSAYPFMYTFPHSWLPLRLAWLGFNWLQEGTGGAGRRVGPQDAGAADCRSAAGAAPAAGRGRPPGPLPAPQCSCWHRQRPCCALWLRGSCSKAGSSAAPSCRRTSSTGTLCQLLFAVPGPTPAGCTCSQTCAAAGTACCCTGCRWPSPCGTSGGSTCCTCGGGTCCCCCCAPAARVAPSAPRYRCSCCTAAVPPNGRVPPSSSRR